MSLITGLDWREPWSDQLVSTFMKEIIKKDILVRIFKQGRNGPKHIKTCQNVALAEIARQFGLMNDLNNVMKIFIKLRFSLMSRMRRLIRRCVARGWPAERALLLAPKWLRVIETRIRLLPVAIKVMSVIFLSIVNKLPFRVGGPNEFHSEFTADFLQCKI
ncbi:unnamed protein product [Parnassius mnemosyne]|uniref:Uncharacterized protein n=1 Tax=Parnassius mnemosyne TaxID=213953 RepID=A0AAV1LH24_9NEOP